MFIFVCSYEVSRLENITMTPDAERQLYMKRSQMYLTKQKNQSILADKDNTELGAIIEQINTNFDDGPLDSWWTKVSNKYI